MNCKFKLQEKRDATMGVYACETCGKSLPLPHAVAKTLTRVCHPDPPSTLFPCAYRGIAVRALDCACNGDAAVFRCNHPDNTTNEATRFRPPIRTKFTGWNCSKCLCTERELEGVQKFATITKRNLIYHCCPLKANDLWRANVRQLLDNADAFNGRRLIAVGTGEGMHEIEEVQKELGSFAELMPIPNDPLLREVVSFLPLLCGVSSTARNEATFYAHTKGNSTADSVEGATYWRNAGYRYLARDWEACAEWMQSFKAVGIHKMVYPSPADSPFPSRLHHGRWMFAGTFFWFRNDQVFGSAKWRNVPVDRYGAEAWLSGILRPEECKSVYQKWPEEIYPTPNPYNPAIYAGEAITDDDVERERIARNPISARTGGPVQ